MTKPSLSPQEVALALKFAHAKGCWASVAEVITEIENQYGELPISKLFPPELLKVAEERGLSVDELFSEMLSELREDNAAFERMMNKFDQVNVSDYVVSGSVVPEA